MYEPSAASRVGAMAAFDLYVAYINAGFTEDQAMKLIMAVISAMATGQMKQEGEE